MFAASRRLLIQPFREPNIAVDVWYLLKFATTDRQISGSHTKKPSVVEGCECFIYLCFT